MTRTRQDVEKIINNLGYIFIDQYIKDYRRYVVFKDDEGYKYNVLFVVLLVA